MLVLEGVEDECWRVKTCVKEWKRIWEGVAGR